jgi:geranylgeranyl pyrophosphate synthase
LDRAEKARLEGLFKTGRAVEQDYANLFSTVRENGTVEQILKQAQVQVDEAARHLDPFPDSISRKRLLELNQFVVEREY